MLPSEPWIRGVDLATASVAAWLHPPRADGASDIALPAIGSDERFGSKPVRKAP